MAVTAAILIGLGFSPLAASGLSLIANTAPVAYGALGTPIITLAKVHGYDLMALSAMVGRHLPLFSLLVPFWLIWAFAGRKAMMEIWPAILVSGRELRDPAVPRLQLHRPRARRRDRRDQLDGLPGAVPAGLEAEDDLDFASSLQRPREPIGGDAAPPLGRAPARAAIAPRDAVIRAWTAVGDPHASSCSSGGCRR